MKKIIVLIILFAPLLVAAQQEVKIIDISTDIKNSQTTIVTDSINDISHYSLIRSYRRANIVYTTGDSIAVVSLFQNTKSIEHHKSAIVMADSTDQLFRAVNLPLKRVSEMLISSDSGHLTYAISNKEGEEWSKFKSSNYITTSNIIYVHHNRTTDNQLVAYFFGNGNLTASDSTGKSMLFMITSNDWGRSWSAPQIAVKHNLYSLNNASISLYSGRNRNKNELFMICSSKDTGSLFLSTSSNDGMTWSYPTELPYLENTDNHILSINKNKIALLFTDSNEKNPDNYNDIFIIMTSIKDIKNLKMKGSMYKIHDYTTKQEREMLSHHRLNHSMGGILFKPRRFMFTISTPPKDGMSSTIKASVINVSKRRSKSL